MIPVLVKEDGSGLVRNLISDQLKVDVVFGVVCMHMKAFSHFQR